MMTKLLSAAIVLALFGIVWAAARNLWGPDIAWLVVAAAVWVEVIVLSVRGKTK